MKICTTCGRSKPASGFQVRRASKDGRTASCKVCLRERDAARYPAEREQRTKAARRYAKTERGRAIIRKSHQRYWARNRLKRAAHIATGNAIRGGQLTRGPCEKCGSPAAQAHHDDYRKPLAVRWLCRRHHLEAHA